MTDKAKTAEEIAKAAEEVSKTWPDVASEALQGLKAGIGEAASLIGDVASQLSKAAPQIWKGLVEYHRWVAIGSLIETLVYLAVSSVFFYYSLKWAKHLYKEDRDDEGWFWGSAAVAVVSVIVFFGGVSSLTRDIADVIVPERRAAIEVINIALGRANTSNCGCGGPQEKTYVPER